MQTQILHVHSDPADFIEQIAQSVFDRLRPLVEQVQQPTDTTPRTRKQAARYLGVSLTTLNTYERNGLINGYRVGTRRLYRVEDLDNAMKAVRRTAGKEAARA